MNGWNLWQTAAGLAVDNPLLTRLALVSLELAALAGVVSLLIHVLRVKTPRLRALLWLVVLAKPLLGLMIGTPWPLLFFERQAATHTRASVAAIDGLNLLLKNPLTLEDVSQTQGQKQHSAKSSGPGKINYSGTIDASTARIASPTPAIHLLPALSPGRILSGIWLVGVFAMIGWMLRDVMQLRALRRTTDSPDEPLRSEYQAVAREMGIHVAPELHITDALDSPALGGLFRPVVLLPRWLAESAAPVRLDWLLRHELMHWKLSDPLALALRRLAEILFFFHPAVWWAGHKWEEAMELACDRALVRTDKDARHYAEQLYGVLENRASRQRSALRMGLCATRTQIGKRIALLLSNPLRFPARLSAISFTGFILVALLGFSVGLGIHEPAKASKSPESAKMAQLSSDKETAKQVEQTRKDLRSMAVGLVAYKIDNKTYPFFAHTLTTPIAYLSKLPPDPFANQSIAPPSGYRPDPGPQYLKMLYAPDLKTVRFYSVGPDGKDEQGAIVYDPSNGTVSRGDIVFTQETRDYLRTNDSNLEKKVLAQRADLGMLEGAVESYFQRHQALPENLNQLVGPETNLSKVPEDKFAPGRQVSYLFSADKQTATIYSVGPDGKDDKGLVGMSGSVGKGEIPKGDILKQVPLKQFTDSRKNQRELTQKLQDALVELRKKTGRDNAMIHYIEASIVMGFVPDDGEFDLVKDTLAYGWSEKSRPLLVTLSRFQASLAEVRKGAALDYAVNYIGTNFMETPVPNFLGAQVQGRMLCVEGRWLEAQGQPAKALDNYLTALTMGRDYGAPDSVLISGLIGIAIQYISLNQITHLAAAGTLDFASLEHAQARLKIIEKTQGQITQWMKGEWHCHEGDFEMAHKDPDKLRKESKNSGESATFIEDFIKNVDQIKVDYEREFAFWDRQFSTPSWQRLPQEKKHLMIEKSHTPNFYEADVRWNTMLARLAEAQVAVALERYHLDHGKYSASLADLVPAYIDSSPLVDPFSGHSLGYQRSGVNTYRLWSVGPDMQNQSGSTMYDPTNGTSSAGDLVAVQ